MTLRSTIDSLLLKLHNANEYCNKMQKAYKQRYDDELLIHNLQKKSAIPMPRSTRIILIGVCIFGLALWYAYVFKVI